MNRPEQALHRSVVSFLRVVLPKPWVFFHPANGGSRSKAEAGIFKAMGVRAGIPDLVLLGPRELAPFGLKIPQVVCIEFKAPKGSLSPAQKDTIAALAELGIETHIVRSIDEAEAVLRGLGVPLKGKCR